MFGVEPDRHGDIVSRAVGIPLPKEALFVYADARVVRQQATLKRIQSRVRRQAHLPLQLGSAAAVEELLLEASHSSLGRGWRRKEAAHLFQAVVILTVVVLLALHRNFRVRVEQPRHPRGAHALRHPHDQWLRAYERKTGGGSVNVSVTIGNEGAASRQAQHGGDRATLRSEAFRHEPVQRPAAGPRGWAACTCGGARRRAVFGMGGVGGLRKGARPRRPRRWLVCREEDTRETMGREGGHTSRCALDDYSSKPRPHHTTRKKGGTT